MQPHYIEFNGKHPKATKKNRVYTDKPDNRWSSYGCSYSDEFLKLDIDDYDHKTGVPEEPIHDKPRSEAVIKLLNSLGIRYNGIKTENGVHLFFRTPKGLKHKNIAPWYCVIGVKCEWKFLESDDHIPLKINKTKRKFFKGSLENTDIDELPFFLMPLQKSKEKPFDISFPEGERTQELGGYLFHLVSKKGFTAEQAFNIIRYMNSYVFEKPIPKRILDAQILNDSTLEKLTAAHKEAETKNISHTAVGDEIIARFNLIYCKSEFYSYENGVYRPFEADKIRAYMSEHYPMMKLSFKKEMIDYMKGKANREEPKDSSIINVKNGILSISGDTVILNPHSSDIVSFKQFNAAYNLYQKSALLEESLSKWFDDDTEQITLFKQLLGYLMMNHVDYEKVFFFVGMPSTGKTKLLKVIQNFCGKENVSSIPLQKMEQKFGLSGIVDKTLNIVSDLPKIKLLKSDTFKMLADGSEISISRKYQKDIDYAYTGKLIFGMNQFPDMSNDFAGVARRIVIFQFNHVFRESDPNSNPHIDSDLSTDECMSALLNMAIEGYQSLVQNKGFTPSKASQRALKEFVVENDSVLQWIKDEEITEHNLLHDPIKYQSRGLYPQYKCFCYSIGAEPKEQKDFTRSIINNFGFTTTRKRVQGTRCVWFVK